MGCKESNGVRPKLQTPELHRRIVQLYTEKRVNPSSIAVRLSIPRRIVLMELRRGSVKERPGGEFSKEAVGMLNVSLWGGEPCSLSI